MLNGVCLSLPPLFFVAVWQRREFCRRVAKLVELVAILLVAMTV